MKVVGLVLGAGVLWWLFRPERPVEQLAVRRAQARTSGPGVRLQLATIRANPRIKRY